MQGSRKSGHAAKAIAWWCLAAGWIIVLFFFSSQTAVESSKLSGSLAEKILRHLPFLDVSGSTFETVLRKLAHFGIFAAEGFLIRVALYNTKSRRHANTGIALLLCLPLAVANELSELTALGRSCSVRDMGIDMSGAILGILVAALLCWIAESARIRGEYARMRGAGT